VSDLALDPVTGDLLIEGGDAVLIGGAEAIAQDWARRMTLFKGEWKIDRRVGIDYQRLIFDARPSNALLRHVFETVTRETAGIASVDRLEFTFDRHTRELEVRAAATANTGEPLALVFRDVLFATTTDQQAQP
jgi:hypothetical protein